MDSAQRRQSAADDGTSKPNRNQDDILPNINSVEDDLNDEDDQHLLENDLDENNNINSNRNRNSSSNAASGNNNNNQHLLQHGLLTNV